MPAGNIFFEKRQKEKSRDEWNITSAGSFHWELTEKENSKFYIFSAFSRLTQETNFKVQVEKFRHKNDENFFINQIFKSLLMIINGFEFRKLPPAIISQPSWLSGERVTGSQNESTT